MLLQRLLCAIFTVHKTIHTLFDLSVRSSHALVHSCYTFTVDDIQCLRFAEIGCFPIRQQRQTQKKVKLKEYVYI